MVNTKQRFTAMVVALVMAVSILAGMGTVTASAATTEKWDGSIDVSWYNTTDTEFHIETPAQLAGVAAIVNGVVLNDAENPDPEKIQYVTAPEAVNDQGKEVRGIEDFKGKTIYLDADLDMGGVKSGDTWSGPCFAPIGGQWITVEGTDKIPPLNASFNGTLDGQGHTISNIYCEMDTGMDSPVHWPCRKAGMP